MDEAKETLEEELTKPTVDGPDTIADKEARRLKRRAKRKRGDGQITVAPGERAEASFKALRKLLNKRNQSMRK